MSKRITLKLNREQRTIEVEPSDILLDVPAREDRCQKPEDRLRTRRLRRLHRPARWQIRAQLPHSGHRGGWPPNHDRRRTKPCRPDAVAAVVSQAWRLPMRVLRAGHRAFGDRASEKNPHPSEAEVKEAIAGNLCRCTGYKPIINAILAVSAPSEKAGGLK